MEVATLRRAVPPAAADLVRYPMRRVELRARLTRLYWRQRFHSFGERSIVHRPGGVFGAHQIAIGSSSLILGGCYLSVETRAWHRPAPALSIGSRVGIRPYCMISASESIVIEDDVIIGAFSSVIDSDHTFAEGRPNVMHNSVASSPIRIGRGTWLAERVSVLRGSSIGRCCIVGAGSVVRGELPDYSIAVGAPARVVGEVSQVDADDPPFSERLW
jgi:acetyltransferase-like isoleucine patch superfamily enzyme